MEKLFIFMILLFIVYKIYNTFIVENYDDIDNSKPMAEYTSTNDQLLYNRGPQIIYDDIYPYIPYYSPYYMPYYIYDFYNPYFGQLNQYYDNYNQKTFNRGYRWSTRKTHRDIHLNKNK